MSIEFIVNRYLKEDKPHGSAGGLYNFRDLLMEDSPVGIFTLLDYNILVMIMCRLLGIITTELVTRNIRIDQIWSKKSENISEAAASSYLAITLTWLTFLTWQSHIFLLNCDVCCSFPLPEMLGIWLFLSLFILLSHFLTFILLLS